MKKLVWIIGILFILTINVYAVSTDSDSIKIGFPFLKGFSSYNENGKPEGYMYDYLNEVQRYTGWQYDFIEGTVEELEQKLLTGKIDLLGVIGYQPELAEKFNISEAPIGEVYIQILSLKEKKIDLENCYRVGAFKKDIREIEKLESFIAVNRLEMEIISYDTIEGLEQAWNNQEIDAILGNSISKRKLDDVVATINAYPHYIITQKENTQLIEELNEAIRYIGVNKPHLKQELYTKYFFNNDLQGLTVKEEQYLQEEQVIRVGYIDERFPFSYQDEAKGRVVGISIEIFEKLLEDTALQISYIPIENIKKVDEKFENNEIDIFMGSDMIQTYSEQEYYRVSNDYLKLPIRYVSHKKEIQDKVLLLPTFLEDKQKELSIDTDMIQQVDYKMIEDSIESINKNPKYFSFISSYTALAYINSTLVHNVVIKPTQYTVGENFWVAEEDLEFFKLINKKINLLKEDEKQEIIYSHLVRRDQKMSFKEILYTYAEEIIIFFILGVVTILLGTVVYFKMKLRYHREINSILKKNAEKDFITNLYNRKTFEYKLKEHLLYGDRRHRPALMLIDIDYFKEVNDTLGHLVGDKVVREIADEIKATFYGDIIGRWGGDEFIVLVKDFNAKTVDKIQAFCRAMNKDVREEQSEKIVQISVSIGIAPLQMDEWNEDKIQQSYEEADIALYYVKENGKNGYRIFQE